MGWSDVVARISATGGVTDVAIFDQEGDLLAATPGYTVGVCEGRSLLRSLSDISQSIAKLTVNGEEFLCIRGPLNCLIGCANNTVVRTPWQRKMAAYRWINHVIVCMGTTYSSGSYLSALAESLEDVNVL